MTSSSVKRSLIVLGGLAVVALVIGGGWWERRSQVPRSAVQMKQADVLYWYDPMFPQQHFDKPGKSPFMDMQLVPRRAGQSAQVGTARSVQIGPGVQQNLGVRFSRVERITLASQIDASGLLSLNDRDVAVVQARAAGFVERVWPIAPGDKVKAGDPLMEILTPEWAAAQHEFLAITKSGDADLAEAARDRMRLLGIGEAQIHELETTDVVRPRFIVRAPISGIVQTLDARAGMTVMSGQTLLRINGLSVVWLEVAVPDSLAASVHAGDEVEVRLVDAPATPLVGHVGAILPVLNETTRTLRVRVELANPQGTLRAGQSAQVTLKSASKVSALAVATEAVIRTGKRALVMLAEPGGFRPQEVSLGQEVGDRTVISSGLTEGQQVVASGQFLLDSEASLRGIDLPAMEKGK
jgi:Cu(I)/Ag(I) efflux system membrane fusion protein